MHAVALNADASPIASQETFDTASGSVSYTHLTLPTN